MTQVRFSTRDYFRDAVRYVRESPLSSADVVPAYQLPARPRRTPSRGEGRPEGLVGDLWDTSGRIGRGELRPSDSIGAASEAIAAFATEFGAFEYSAEAAANDASGTLRGIPITVKDIIDVEGMPTSGSSRAIAAKVAATDAAAIARLRAAGATIMGKVATHEFALGVTTPQSKNPWDVSRIPGGSSGGSAISLVTGMALGSLGTDTRASIRVPSALCGLVGFKPSLATVPIDHWLTLSWTMDHFAPMARSVRDIAMLMDVLVDDQRFVSALPGNISGVRFGWSPALVRGTAPGVKVAFNSAVEAIVTAGGSVREIAIPGDEDLALANAAGMVLSRSEAARFHTENGTDLALCTNEVRMQLEEALEVRATDLVRCFQLRGLLRERLESVFSDVDVLLMPTTKVVAPPREDADDYLLVLSETCIPWSFVDFPAISVFAGLDGHLPAGIQLVGPPAGDEFLLSVAHGVEQVLPKPPSWRHA